jgi:hypothetical protein
VLADEIAGPGGGVGSQVPNQRPGNSYTPVHIIGSGPGVRFHDHVVGERVIDYCAELCGSKRNGTYRTSFSRGSPIAK